MADRFQEEFRQGNNSFFSNCCYLPHSQYFLMQRNSIDHTKNLSCRIFYCIFDQNTPNLFALMHECNPVYQICCILHALFNTPRINLKMPKVKMKYTQDFFCVALVPKLKRWDVLYFQVYTANYITRGIHLFTFPLSFSFHCGIGFGNNANITF